MKSYKRLYSLRLSLHIQGGITDLGHKKHRAQCSLALEATGEMEKKERHKIDYLLRGK